MGFSIVAYPWTLVASKLKGIRDTLENLKASLTVGAPPMILSYDEVCSGVGFPRYWVGRPAFHMGECHALTKDSSRTRNRDTSMMAREWYRAKGTSDQNYDGQRVCSCRLFSFISNLQMLTEAIVVFRGLVS